ncbi:unnamed protein product, partial [Urochloa humidicola]
MSRQARKEAAAAAQELLKVDADQVQKVAAAQLRKDAAAPMQMGNNATPPGGFANFITPQFGALKPPQTVMRHLGLRSESCRSNRHLGLRSESCRSNRQSLPILQQRSKRKQQRRLISAVKILNKWCYQVLQ